MEFPGVLANDDVSLTIHKGEVFALVGENGAGKTTLMNILYGINEPTNGEVYIRGKKVERFTPKNAISMGVGMVHQHFMLVPSFTVAQNIVMSREPRRMGFLFDNKAAEAQTRRLVEEYGIDLFRLDYNLGESDLLLRTAHAGGTECSQLRYDRAVCDMYARLRARYPQVVFENCAGGGGRTDVGFVRQFTHTWVSDWNRAPRSLAVANGMTMALPPEKVDRLVSGMDCHTRADLDFQLRVTLFGRPTTNDYNPIGSAANPGQLARVRHAFELYKGFIRPLGRDALIFHHTPVLSGVQPGGVCVLERASYDRMRAVIGAFRLSGDAPDEAVVYPRGLSPALDYRVTLDNSGDRFEASGRELTQNGLRIRLTHALTSELVLLEAR